jgi:hypothetical protein
MGYKIPHGRYLFLVKFEGIPQIAVFVGFQWNEIIAGILVALPSGDARDKW